MSVKIEEPPRPTDASLILPFVKSTRSVLHTMLNLEPVLGKPCIKTSHEPSYDYSGIISFSGKIIGSVVVSFHRETAIRMVAAFAGMPIEPDTSDFADAIGELANMIVGAAKKDLGAIANISVPSVVMGARHVIARPTDIPCLQIPCKTSAGDFAIEISIRSL